MKKVRWVSATAGAALVAAMFALPGAGVAYASDNGNTTGNGNISILSGNSVTAPVSAPVNLCGISLAVAGFSNAGCAGGSSSTISNVGNGSDNGNVTGNFNIPIGSGNTVTAPVSVPVNVCGNAVAAGGFANANCKGGSTSCIGNDCNQPGCHGPQCHECHGPQCHPCQGNDLPPVPRSAVPPVPGQQLPLHGQQLPPVQAQLRWHPARLHDQLRRYPAWLHGQLRWHPARRHHPRRHHHDGEHRQGA